MGRPEGAGHRSGRLEKENAPVKKWPARSLIWRLIAKVQITPRETEDYCGRTSRIIGVPLRSGLRHLVVQKKGDLQKVLESLKKGERTFPRLSPLFPWARKNPRAGIGASWTRTACPRSISRLLGGLKPGEISKPLKDNFGYHLFQLIEWRDQPDEAFRGSEGPDPRRPRERGAGPSFRTSG